MTFIQLVAHFTSKSPESEALVHRHQVKFQTQDQKRAICLVGSNNSKVDLKGDLPHLPQEKRPVLSWVFSSSYYAAAQLREPILAIETPSVKPTESSTTTIVARPTSNSDTSNSDSQTDGPEARVRFKVKDSRGFILQMIGSLLVKEAQVHFGITCDYCEESDFRDYRYKCLVCQIMIFVAGVLSCVIRIMTIA